jgi:hypothetical protein
VATARNKAIEHTLGVVRQIGAVPVLKRRAGSLPIRVNDDSLLSIAESVGERL